MNVRYNTEAWLKGCFKRHRHNIGQCAMSSLCSVFQELPWRLKLYTEAQMKKKPIQV